MSAKTNEQPNREIALDPASLTVGLHTWQFDYEVARDFHRLDRKFFEQCLLAGLNNAPALGFRSNLLRRWQIPKMNVIKIQQIHLTFEINS